MFFSVMTKNLNWEISTKNLVTFKRWDGVNRLMVKILISQKFTEKSGIFFGGGRGCMKKVFGCGSEGGSESLKKRELGQFADLTGDLAKERGHVFEVGRG